jgi:hypothetical protein
MDTQKRVNELLWLQFLIQTPEVERSPQEWELYLWCHRN